MRRPLLFYALIASSTAIAIAGGIALKTSKSKVQQLKEKVSVLTDSLVVEKLRKQELVRAAESRSQNVKGDTLLTTPSKPLTYRDAVALSGKISQLISKPDRLLYGEITIDCIELPGKMNFYLYDKEGHIVFKDIVTIIRFDGKSRSFVAKTAKVFIDSTDNVSFGEMIGGQMKVQGDSGCGGKLNANLKFSNSKAIRFNVEAESGTYYPYSKSITLSDVRSSK